MARHIEHAWIVSSAQNPKEVSNEQIAAIAASLRQCGFNSPALADNPGHRPRRGDRSGS